MKRATGNHEVNTDQPKKAAPPEDRAKTAEYFSRLRLRVKLGFLAAFLIPPIALSAYFHFQFNSTLEESGKLHLASLAESQKNTIDLFLQERVVNVFSLFHSAEFDVDPSQEVMDRYLQTLRQTSDAFIDVGFCDSQGAQIGYAGPFTYLLGKDYGSEDWFVAVMEQERDYYISDIYLGFRNDPHFTIAVKQRIDAKPYIVRATLDPDKFYLFLRSIGRGKGVDSALVNNQGRYQIVDPDKGELLGTSEYIPSASEGHGVEEARIDGNSILAAYVWLEETPWALVIRQPLSVAYAQMYRTQKIMIASTALIIIVVAVSIWMITDRLLRRAQATARSREELRLQLVHAAKLASLGELAAGIAHEINNPLAIIAATTGCIRDMFDPEFEVQWTPESVKEELANIDSAVFKARGITQTLLKFSRKNPPRLVPRNVNKILEQVVAGLKEREFELSDIELVRDYDPHLPDITLDPDQISQVFLNLINNAGDAIDGTGTITLATHHDDSCIRITVSDNGAGMPAEIMEKIFVPFFTTKDVGKGTGLGLSISSSIVESMGGRIEVQSVQGAGSSFTVVLPLAESEHVENGSA
ncbi:MAG: histidine kinase [Planctomycetes bacterium]|nr:histidine kinase [Planctomycetota bacterium]MBL7043472.1 histidine kinase [Pirellulaceae bacterium]